MIKEIRTSKIDERVGKDGPKFDPYIMKELTFTQGDRIIIYHIGFINFVRLQVSGKLCNTFYEEKGHDLESTFEKLSNGFTIKQAYRAYNRIVNPTKCKYCGSKKLDSKKGYPGETFLICEHCGQINACKFNLTEVM